MDKAISEAKAQNRDILRVEDFKISTDGLNHSFDYANQSLYIKSRIRVYLEIKGYKPSSNVLDGGILNKIISDLFDNAITKAMADNRKFIGRIDFE